MNSLFLDPTDLNAYGRNLAQFLLIGGAQLETQAQGRHQVSFGDWSAAVRKSAGKRDLLVDDIQLQWLWDALLTEPRVRELYGSLLLSRDEEWRHRDPVQVLKSGQLLGVFLKPSYSHETSTLYIPNGVYPEGQITLFETLMMRPGKSRRFACMDVAAEVAIKVDDPGTVEQESNLIKMKPEAVVVEGNIVTVSVRSLNQAYTVTSRRLETHRRGYGGRIYDHIAWRKGDGWKALETIRCEVESGEWEME